MLKGDWLRHPAAGVAVFAVFGVFLALSASPQSQIVSDRNYAISSKRSYGPTDKEVALDPVPHPKSNKYYEPNERDNTAPKPHEKADLLAQRIMALGTVGILIFTGLGLHYIKRTYEASQRTLKQTWRAGAAARKQINETRRIGEAQTRAYLSVTSAKAIISKKHRGYIDIIVEIENTGNSPAEDVTYNFWVHTEGLQPPQKIIVRVAARTIREIAAKTPLPRHITTYFERDGRTMNELINGVYKLGVSGNVNYRHKLMTTDEPTEVFQFELESRFPGQNTEDDLPLEIHLSTARIGRWGRHENHSENNDS